MKTSLLIMIIGLFSLSTAAQSTIQVGTKWTYSDNQIGGPIGPTYIEIVGDTIIDGIIWYTIEGQGACAFTSANPPLIREEDSKWYTYNVDEDYESILYDFELSAGDSYTVGYFGPNFQIEMVVDSVSTRAINGEDRKVQYCSNPNSSTDGFSFGFEIVEGIGSLGYLLPQGNNCDPHAGPIRCWETELEFMNFDSERGCNESYFPTNTVDYKFVEVRTYPNPSKVNQSITLETNQIIEHLEIYDSVGSKVESQRPNSKITRFELAMQGIYYLVFQSGSNKYYSKITVMQY